MLAAAHGLPDFRPAPGVTHEDHDEEHTGYALAVRVHTLNTGVTVDQADRAVDGYLFEVTKRDDLIVFSGFYDATATRYTTTATWRTEAGAQASFQAATAVSSGNYLTAMTESAYYLGTVDTFAELLEIHSAVLLGNAGAVSVAQLANPSVYNASSMTAGIANNTVPFWEGQSGAIDFTTSFPDTPTSNTHLIVQSSWNSTADVDSGAPAVISHITSQFPGALTGTVTYKGAIRNFWHSAPGTTPPLPGGAASAMASPSAWLAAAALLAWVLA
jgi:hypothetical protein